MYEKCRRQSLMQDFLFGLFAPCRWTSCAKDAAPTISARATWRWATSLARGPPPPTSSLHWPSEYLAEPGLIRYIATDSNADKHRFNSHNSNMTKDWINECIVLIKCFLKFFFLFFLRKLLSHVNSLCHVFFLFCNWGRMKTYCCFRMNQPKALNSCFQISFPSPEMRTVSRCCLCQTSGWWCWRSPSPTCPLTPWTPSRMETMLMPPSLWSLSHPLCPMRAPESHHRFGTLQDE